ncbi:hypothetical protein HDV05_006924, partial [Chytridiales sp. JEL 0842]
MDTAFSDRILLEPAVPPAAESPQSHQGKQRPTTAHHLSRQKIKHHNEHSAPTQRPTTAQPSRQQNKPGWESSTHVPIPRLTSNSAQDPPEKLPVVSKLPPPAPGNEHRRYSSVYPCANRLLAKRWDDAARERHRQKLATMKAYIDNAPPKQPGHLQLRLKRIQQEDDNLAKIERDNHILLDRMARLMTTPQGFSGLDESYHLRPAIQKPTPSARKKKEELQQIEQQNQILMQRVEARGPHYNHESWDEERRLNLSYLQRITRFPEGYQHVLEKEGVPPPVKGPLKIRMNKSETLRQEVLAKKAKAVDEEGSPRRVRSKSAGHSGAESEGDEQHHEEPKDIYLTKAEKLRREYLKMLAENGGKNKWRDRNAMSAKDPTEGVRSEDETYTDSNSARPKTAPTKRIKVRLNRAQRLRLEEAEQKSSHTQEPLWHTKRLKNVEARIDFGHEGWNDGSKATQSAEKEREHQVANANVDEGEYEPEVFLSSEKQAQASSPHLYHGAALREGYILPESFRSSTVTYFSGNLDDACIERNTMYSTVQPRVREAAGSIGLEFLLRDLRWGVPKNVADRHELVELCKEHLELANKNNAGANLISFLSDNRGLPGSLAYSLSPQLYEELVNTLDKSGDDESVALMKKWYRLDENLAPIKHILLPISSFYPEYISIDGDAAKIAATSWSQEVKIPLIKSLSKAANNILGRSQGSEGLSEEDTETLYQLSRNPLEYEFLSVIQQPTDNAASITRTFTGKNQTTDSDTESKAALELLKTKLQAFISTEGQISEEISWASGIAGMQSQKPEVRKYIQKLSENVISFLENALFKEGEEKSVDLVREEILMHTRLFREATYGFVGKTRVVNKALTFFQSRYRYGVPPLIVRGPTGAGKSRLVCQALH